MRVTFGLDLVLRQTTQEGNAVGARLGAVRTWSA